MTWPLPWLPHAGWTEMTQTAFALAGWWLHVVMLTRIWVDGWHLEETADVDATFRANREYHDARTAVNFNLLGELVLLLAQSTLVTVGVISLFTAPPPPARFDELTGPFVAAWVMQHIGHTVMSVVLVTGSLIAMRGRAIITRPWKVTQQVRTAVLHAETASSATLFDQLGGKVALDGIVADLDGRLLHDPQLASYFAGVDMTRLQHSQALVLTRVLQGERVDLRKPHASLAIPDAHFTRFVEHFRDSLQFLGVTPEVIEAVLIVIESARGDIVTKP